MKRLASLKPWFKSNWKYIGYYEEEKKWSKKEEINRVD